MATREAAIHRWHDVLGRFAHKGLGPRYVNAGLSVWLFISAFLWQHFTPMRTNTWVVAVLMFTASIISAAAPSFRFINTILAVWLFFTSVSIRHMGGTELNNVVVAILVFAFSLIPSGTGSTRGRAAGA